MSNTYGPRIVTDGLVLHLDAANNRSYVSGSNTWNDLSGNGNNGTLIQGASFNTSNNGSIIFDGTNDAVTLASKTYSFNGGTLEIWTKLTSKNRQQGFVGINAPPKYLNFWMNTNNTMRWEVIGDTALTYSPISSTTIFSTGVWYHATGTFTGALNSLYINGVLETSSTTGAANVPTSITTTAYIGDYGATAYPLAGNIAVVKLYNRALSRSEIFQNYNATKGRFGL